MEEQRLKFEEDINSQLQSLCEVRKKFIDMEEESKAKGEGVDNDPITRDLVAEPFCRFETVDEVETIVRADIMDYVVRVVEVHVPVKSINPVVLDAVIVSNAASGVVWV